MNEVMTAEKMIEFFNTKKIDTTCMKQALKNKGSVFIKELKANLHWVYAGKAQWNPYGNNSNDVNDYKWQLLNLRISRKENGNMCKDITKALLEDVIEITWMFDSLMEARKIPQWDDLIDYYCFDEIKDIIKKIARQFEEKYPFETTWTDMDFIYLEEIQKFAEEKLLEEFEEDKKGEPMEETLGLIEEVETLDANTPDGLIRDSDTILTDLVEECDFEFSGFAHDIFTIWKNSTDKKAVEQMFYEFTGIEFVNYLSKCIEEISR